MENIRTQSLATIVTQNSATVAVLEKYSLDYCCNGKRSLEEACIAKGLSALDIAEELNLQLESKTSNLMPFESMTAEQLISYILIHHHFYVKQTIPQILFHVEKVAMKHGNRFPYMIEVLEIFKEVQSELLAHLQKEEQILFPRIKQLEYLYLQNQLTEIARNTITGPISVMMAEHDHAGTLLFKIRELTNNYTPPEAACTTFKISLTELKEFEEDLHKHVHLENNLLFVKAQDMLQS